MNQDDLKVICAYPSRLKREKVVHEQKRILKGELHAKYKLFLFERAFKMNRKV